MSVSQLNFGDVTRELLSAVGNNHIAYNPISIANSIGLLRVFRSSGRAKKIDEYFGDRFVLKQHPPEQRAALKIERTAMLQRMKSEPFVDVGIMVRHDSSKAFATLEKDSCIGNDFFADGGYVRYAERAAAWVLQELRINDEIQRLQEEYARAMMAAKSIQQMQTF